jgi:cytochrome c peroxidase
VTRPAPASRHPARPGPDGSPPLFTDFTYDNVGLPRTAPYFHNGAFDTLRETVDFYARRDTHPEAWYPASGAGVRKFDDLPPQHAGAVNTSEVPYERKAGEQAALTDAEIDDIVAFLRTLDDGYN